MTGRKMEPGFVTIKWDFSNPVFTRRDFRPETYPLRNMGIVPELENSFYENRSQRGLSDCREEAHPVWNRACQERGQNQQSQTNHQRAPKQMNERDFLSGGCIHRLS